MDIIINNIPLIKLFIYIFFGIYFGKDIKNLLNSLSSLISRFAARLNYIKYNNGDQSFEAKLEPLDEAGVKEQLENDTIEQNIYFTSNLSSKAECEQIQEIRKNLASLSKDKEEALINALAHSTVENKFYQISNIWVSPVPQLKKLLEALNQKPLFLTELELLYSSSTNPIITLISLSGRKEQIPLPLALEILEHTKLVEEHDSGRWQITEYGREYLAFCTLKRIRYFDFGIGKDR